MRSEAKVGVSGNVSRVFEERGSSQMGARLLTRGWQVREPEQKTKKGGKYTGTLVGEMNHKQRPQTPNDGRKKKFFRDLYSCWGCSMIE